jgi:hypothetical protein
MAGHMQRVHMQVLVADRLIEARAEAMNGHVFNVVSNELLTNLCHEPDLLPLTRRARASMGDGILFHETNPPPNHAPATSDINMPQPPSNRSNVRKRTDSIRNEGSPRMSNVNRKPHSEDDPSSSPRIAAEPVYGTHTRATREDSVQGVRELFFGKNEGPSRVSGFW